MSLKATLLVFHLISSNEVG